MRAWGDPMTRFRSMFYLTTGALAAVAGLSVTIVGIAGGRFVTFVGGIALLAFAGVLLATFVQIRTGRGLRRPGPGERPHVRGAVDTEESQRSGSMGTGFFGGF